jgi:putative polyketide hydroxylase
MRSRDAPVLIVGAGLAGLTHALMLGLRGIPSLVVERRAALSTHPRAHGVNLRTMELFRQAPGLERDLLNASRAAPGDGTLLVAETVTGRRIKVLTRPGDFDSRPYSPATMCSIGQDRVEPILLRHARAQGADIRFSTELVGFSQNEDGVRAVLRDVASGRESAVEADYLIAADGTGSAIRQALGIAMDGMDGVAHAVNILFDADLTAAMDGIGFVLCYIRNADFTGSFVTCDDAGRGKINVEYDPARESLADFDMPRCRSLVRAALGQPELEPEILNVVPWRTSTLLARRMREGRIFLAGDAAHIMPPVGGLAGQVAIQDAADLAWKLAMVIDGRAGPSLLDTYEIERRPVARLAIARAIDNYIERMRPDRMDLYDPLGSISNLDVVLSYRYRSPAIALEEPDDDSPTEDAANPSGRPGTRLAHVPLIRDGVEISTLDLARDRFVLIAGPSGSPWIDAARTTPFGLDALSAALQIGVDLVDPRDSFLRRTGLRPDGALIVRPDGFIAWRSVSSVADPSEALERAIARATCKARSAARAPTIIDRRSGAARCATGTARTTSPPS